MMYEHAAEPLLSREAFLWRALRHVLIGGLLVAAVDGVGTTLYHVLGDLPWADAFLNASMILGGMGPVDALRTTAAKIFAALYALFSGLVFIVAMGVVLGPWAHRMIHHFHLQRRSR